MWELDSLLFQVLGTQAGAVLHKLIFLFVQQCSKSVAMQVLQFLFSKQQTLCDIGEVSDFDSEKA